MGPKLYIFVRFSTTSRLNGEYLRNKTRDRQPVKGIGNYKGSPTWSHNFINVGQQVA